MRWRTPSSSPEVTLRPKGHPRPSDPPRSTAGQPIDPEIEAERTGWADLLAIVRSLTPDEIAAPGYYSEPDWSVATLVGHVGMWLAEAGIQLERIEAGTYEPSDVDIDALNAEFRVALADQPWSVVLAQAETSRARLVEVWARLQPQGGAAAWWVAKAGADHYREHLTRLREWSSELYSRRTDGRYPVARSGAPR